MNIYEFIEKYKSDNFSSYLKENTTIDYWNDLIKNYKLEQIDFSPIEKLLLATNLELVENRDSLSGVRFDVFCERQIKKIEIENQYRPKQNEKKLKSLSMIETFHIGFNDIANEKVYKLELSEEQKEALGFNKNKNDKTIGDYFDNYLNDKKLKEYLNTEFTKAINKTLPKEVKEGCLYCTGNDESVKEEDRKCYNYHVEGQMNEFFAVWWFVNIVENNRQLLSENEALKKLSIKLYECFLFKDGRVFFDLRKLTMYCLEQGFLTLSNIFAKNDKINSLEIINQAIENLDSEYLSIKMFEKTEPYHIEPQKLFLESKRKSIKEQLKIDRLKSKKNEPQQTENSKPDEVEINLRNDIFMGNAIKLFQYYYECKSMVNNSRVHFRFLFEVMKKDGFIHDTVLLGQYIKFITKEYDYVDTELKTINLNSKPNKNNYKDYLRYKEDLKTTLK